MEQSDFLLGCNYWASNAGVYMWRNYEKSVVENDLKFLAAHGINTIRIFPLWPDFQPLNKLIFCNEGVGKTCSFGMRKDEEALIYQKYPDSGLDETQVENMRHLLSVAKNNGINVILSIITGWMSGRKFVPTAFIGRDLIKDAEVMLYECAFVKDLISAVKDFDNIIAYEPGNETNCLSYDITDYEATLWCKIICDTIRLADSTRPIYSGMHESSCKGKWNIPVQGRIFDMLSSHPYPLFTPYCQQEKLTSMRASMHAAVENSYYMSIARKPSIVEEIGTLGPTILNDDLSAEYAETALITSYMTGSTGFLWWCAFDQDGLDFAPYDLFDLEVRLGMSTIDYKAKPVLLKMKEMNEVLQNIGKLPLPQSDAVCIITNTVDHWAVSYGAFMLGIHSGRYIDFCYEEQLLKDAEYYILPGLQSSHTLPKAQWERLEEKIKNGAKLLITCDGGAIRNFEQLTGLSVCGREKIGNKIEFEINGKSIIANRNVKVYLESKTANVRIKDKDGQIVFSENKFGKGSVMFLNMSLETLYTQAYYPENTALYEIYNLFFQDKIKTFSINNPRVFTATYLMEDEKISVMIYNFDANQKHFDFVLDENYVVEKALYADIDGGVLKMQERYAYLVLKKIS